jgi:putative DNA methylase
LASLSLAAITEFFDVTPLGVLPESSPIDWSNPQFSDVTVTWREDLPSSERRRLEAQMLPQASYRERVDQSLRAEEVSDTVDSHIWETVNSHLGTTALSIPQLIEQLGVMRFGRRPQVADTFCGSGQIPFEAARLGCDVDASDLNPVACMLTWGAFNIIGSPKQKRVDLEERQQELVANVQAHVDSLHVEDGSDGWRPKAFLYCLEARCPQTGWLVPIIPSRVVSKGRGAIARLVPDPENMRYEIQVDSGVSEQGLLHAEQGTVDRDGKYGEAHLTHTINNLTYRTKISTLRGDFQKSDGSVGNRLRPWEQSEFMARPDDLLQDRLYCIQWTRPKKKGRAYDYEFRAVTEDDLSREIAIQKFMSQNLSSWQAKGWVPDMRIEIGGPPRYQGLDLIRARGWTHWHHLFNPRQLFVNGLVNQFARSAELRFGVCQVANFNSKLSRWNSGPGVDAVIDTFYNQALNTIYNYGSRSSRNISNQIATDYKHFPLSSGTTVRCQPADRFAGSPDIVVTDPPYGDAVKYEEILDYFIAWLRKATPPEFATWVWDSRRSLAIKGEDEDFRRGMVAAYSRLSECMTDHGIQVIMFTHQSGAIWADMANIVWASGLQVTAAWYVVTETDSPLREGSFVKGTVLLVLRKRHGTHKTNRDDLAWEIQEEVEGQVRALTGLNQEAKGLYRDENVFEDADIQMAGYAAALTVAHG